MYVHSKELALHEDTFQSESFVNELVYKDLFLQEY